VQFVVIFNVVFFILICYFWRHIILLTKTMWSGEWCIGCSCHVLQEIWANAHEMRESLYQFLFAGSLGFYPSISSEFMLLQPKLQKKITKNSYFGVQGHLRSSMLQFLIPLKSSYQVRGSGLWLLKSTFNAENFICRLSWSVSSHFDTIHLEMCVAA